MNQSSGCIRKARIVQAGNENGGRPFRGVCIFGRPGKAVLRGTRLRLTHSPPSIDFEEWAMRTPVNAAFSKVVLLVVAGWLAGVPGASRADDQKTLAAPRGLLIAFASLRERPAF